MNIVRIHDIVDEDMHFIIAFIVRSYSLDAEDEWIINQSGICLLKLFQYHGLKL